MRPPPVARPHPVRAPRAVAAHRPHRAGAQQCRRPTDLRRRRVPRVSSERFPRSQDTLDGRRRRPCHSAQRNHARTASAGAGRSRPTAPDANVSPVHAAHSHDTLGGPRDTGRVVGAARGALRHGRDRDRQRASGRAAGRGPRERVVRAASPTLTTRSTVDSTPAVSPARRNHADATFADAQPKDPVHVGPQRLRPDRSCAEAGEEPESRRGPRFTGVLGGGRRRRRPPGARQPAARSRNLIAVRKRRRRGEPFAAGRRPTVGPDAPRDNDDVLGDHHRDRASRVTRRADRTAGEPAPGRAHVVPERVDRSPCAAASGPAGGRRPVPRRARGSHAIRRRARWTDGSGGFGVPGGRRSARRGSSRPRRPGADRGRSQTPAPPRPATSPVPLPAESARCHGHCHGAAGALGPAADDDARGRVGFVRGGRGPVRPTECRSHFSVVPIVSACRSELSRSSSGKPRSAQTEIAKACAAHPSSSRSVDYHVPRGTRVGSAALRAPAATGTTGRAASAHDHIFTHIWGQLCGLSAGGPWIVALGSVDNSCGCGGWIRDNGAGWRLSTAGGGPPPVVPGARPHRAAPRDLRRRRPSTPSTGPIAVAGSLS